ncbi:MAG TPA: glycoside hydrolase family 3 N-terminal domain-containing protein [Bacteroidia bacterium]|nr:glycoside hydrolase family 3 N-terminal domain-containing protein [Bacteroidia bacterium]
MKKPILLLLSLFFLAFVYAPLKKQDPEFAGIQNPWVDSVFNALSPDERIAQLFMVAAYSNRDLKHVKEISDLIRNYNIGGLIWMQGGPLRQGKLANYYQSFAKTPLLYSIDAEWGLAMRIDSTIRYPKQMTLGAIQNDSLIYQMGRQIARECKRLGLHVNFAPVADVNNNPLNPVIGLRSFGENKEAVARKAYFYMKGLQDEMVMACGKHFPGHGDTDSDSHLTLPQLNHSASRLDSLELYPFRYLFERGLASVMVAHLNIPSLDTARKLPSTLSAKVVNDLLKTRLGYKGLIFTDAMNMKGIANGFAPGTMEVKALQAGNDVLLFPADVPKAIEAIKQAVASGQLSQTAIDERCKKLLQAKYWCGLSNKQEIVTRNLYKELNTSAGNKLNEKLAEAAVTLLRNEKQILPLKHTDSLRILELSYGVEEENALYAQLKNYAYTEHAGLSHEAGPDQINLAFEKVRRADLVVIQLNKAGAKPENNYGIGSQTLWLMDSVSRIKPCILVVATNPYILNKLISLRHFQSVIMAYEYLPSLLRASANLILGMQQAQGKLPVSTIPFKYNSGLELQIRKRSELDSLASRFRERQFGLVDSLALAGISEKAYPGCQVLAMKDGSVIYQKSFGNYTYAQDSKPVDNGTLYDLASLTKISSTAFALMKLQGEGKFDYKKTLGEYLPELKGSNKENLVIEDVLTHQAGLEAWIPFYLKTIEKSGELKPGFYAKAPSEEYPIPVARDLYLKKSYPDSIYQRIIDSKVENRGKYLYSDLGYYFLQKIIEQLSGKKQNQYVSDLNFTAGLGLNYLPLNFTSKTLIAPTENDDKFRRQIIQGYVHDPGAAMLGGVAAHAGEFANAYEVARLMQIYLNKGNFNGTQILDSNVVKDYTACHFCPANRRGLCFDKPEPDANKESPVTAECSPLSFGHSGFTGTFAWADPANKLVFVFLSNRVFPTADENKLAKLAIRSKIHKAFYEALK